MRVGEKFADFSKNRSRYSKQAKINLIEKSGPIHNIKEKFNKQIIAVIYYELGKTYIDDVHTRPNLILRIIM